MYFAICGRIKMTKTIVDDKSINIFGFEAEIVIFDARNGNMEQRKAIQIATLEFGNTSICGVSYCVGCRHSCHSPHIHNRNGPPPENQTIEMNENEQSKKFTRQIEIQRFGEGVCVCVACAQHRDNTMANTIAISFLNENSAHSDNFFRCRE